MRFLTPAYLLGGALIALPIVLHWLRRDRAPNVPFTAVRLLQASQIDRSRRRRFRDLLLLAARIVALLLLAAAFARPYVVGSQGISRPTIVAIDRSFSMSAPGRMARAREMARQAVADAGNDRVGLIAFDQRADVVAPVGSAADARAAIDRIDVGFSGTHYGAVLDKATELLAQDAGGRLVIVTDMQRGGFDGGIATVPDNVELIVRDVGGATANVAVTDVRVEARRVVATILNVGAGARQLQARLEVAGQTRAVRPVSVGAIASVDVAFDGVAPVGPFAVAVDDAEGYAADNIRYSVNSARTLPRVLIVGGGDGSGDGFYVSRGLQAGGDEGSDFDVKLVSGGAFAAMSPDDIKGQSAIVLLSTHGVDRRVREPLRSFFEAGGGLLIAAANDVDGSVLSTALDWTPPLKSREHAGRGVLTATDLRHPIFRPFAAIAANLSQVTFERVWEVDPAKDWRVVARFTDGGAALLERTAGRGRILLFASDLDRRWNDFPLHSTYVPFVQESLRYLGARLPTSGSVLVSDVPRGVPAKPGVVDGDGRLIAVNVDQRESTIDRVSPTEFGRLITRTPADSRPAALATVELIEARQHYWQYGLLLMLAVLIAEAFVGAF